MLSTPPYWFKLHGNISNIFLSHRTCIICLNLDLYNFAYRSESRIAAVGVGMACGSISHGRSGPAKNEIALQNCKEQNLALC